jgi:hypothetical protein
MPSRKVLTVGLELASSDTQSASFQSKQSLLDWDIVLFKPEISDFVYSSEYYLGKPSLSDTASFHLKESCEHWRREIKQAVETGKTVLVFLPELYEVYIDTGQRSYSGTGRNQKTTRHVALYNNYETIPATLAPVSSTGSAMKLTQRGAEEIVSFWKEFEPESKYNVLLTDPKVPACIVTRTGDRAVGAIYRSKASTGTLLLLPDIEFYPDGFIKEKGDKRTWTPAASQFAVRFVAAVIALDRTLRSSGEVTPEPQWATAERYALGPEASLRQQLLEAEREVEAAQKRKESLLDELKSAGNFRALLFEKGKPLENAIIQALRLLAFTAVPFKDSSSEFDVVFESAEGRLIGEAEGKDNKAVNVDKLRQLAMNIHEDLQRDEVTNPAKPVLFGNAFRLQPVEDRGEPFTEKCCSAAAASSTALVFTPDLFVSAQYLMVQSDDQYAQRCRVALLSGVGRVTFPAPPSPAPTSETVESARA